MEKLKPTNPSSLNQWLGVILISVVLILLSVTFSVMSAIMLKLDQSEPEVVKVEGDSTESEN